MIPWLEPATVHGVQTTIVTKMVGQLAAPRMAGNRVPRLNQNAKSTLVMIPRLEQATARTHQTTIAMKVGGPLVAQRTMENRVLILNQNAKLMMVTVLRSLVLRFVHSHQTTIVMLLAGLHAVEKMVAAQTKILIVTASSWLATLIAARAGHPHRCSRFLLHLWLTMTLVLLVRSPWLLALLLLDWLVFSFPTKIRLTYMHEKKMLHDVHINEIKICVRFAHSLT